MMNAVPDNDNDNVDEGQTPDWLDEVPDDLDEVPDDLDEVPDDLDEVPDDLDEVPDDLVDEDEFATEADSPETGEDEREPKDVPEADEPAEAETGAEAGTETETPAAEPAEPEAPKPPDDQRCVAALAKLGARLDMNDQGNVWRAFFYRNHGDAALNHIFGLPSLTELWVIGSKVSAASIAEIKAEKPDLTIQE